MQKIINIQGMHCVSCEIIIQEELMELPEVTQVDANYRTGKIIIQYNKHIDEKNIVQKITHIGYTIGTNKKPRLTNDPYVYMHAIGASILIIVGVYIFTIYSGTNTTTRDLQTNGWMSMLGVGLLAGMSTCMAVVGGILITLVAKRSKDKQQTYTEKLRPQLYFHTGRLVMFVVGGGLLGLLGTVVQLSNRGYVILFLFVAIVMIISGLQLTDIFPRLAGYQIHFPKSMQHILRKRGQDKGMMIESAITGGATFFVPCGFTIIAQAYAASTGSFLLGAATMGVFVLGTLPGLVGIGGLTAVLHGQKSRIIFRFLGILLLAFAIYNISLAHNYWIGIQQSHVSEVVQTIPDEQKPLIQISMIQGGRGYTPNILSIPKNSTIELTIDSQDQYTCASSFWIPSKNIKLLLKPGKNIISFTTDNEDQIVFGCGMMMYKGKFLVQ